jgi:hypothetical protein
MPITNRNVYTKPTVPTLGAAGSIINDPTFNTRILRVTDGSTRTGAQANYSYRSPGSPTQHAWNYDTTRFYAWSTDATIWPYTFNAAAMSATRGAAALQMISDVSWSDATPNMIYGPSSTAANHHTVSACDITGPTYSTLFDCEVLIPALASAGDTYIGVCMTGSDNLLVTCGGASQEFHHYAIWYPLSNPSAKKIIDTQVRVGSNYTLHSAKIDRSGRYVTLEWSTVGSPAFPMSIWDTTTDTITNVTVHGNGHMVFGYNGWLVNQEYLTTYDPAQWLLRNAATPNTGLVELIAPLATPAELFLGEHPSWGNALPGSMEPVSSSLFRYYDGPFNVAPNKNDAPWRVFDDEIISFNTDGGPTVVTRHVHTRTRVWPESGTGPFEFWTTPRVNVSRDGKWFMWTSNWEHTLGIDASEGIHRQDLFIAERLFDVAADLRVARTRTGTKVYVR